jgi:hypothetical protein
MRLWWGHPAVEQIVFWGSGTRCPRGTTCSRASGTTTASSRATARPWCRC